MRDFENSLYNSGINYICGTDEVGRGCIAGPLFAAAVILPINFSNDKINDSKKLSPKAREEAYKIIIDNAIDYSVAVIKVNKIDSINVKNASKLAMKTAIEKLKIQPEHILIDFEKININIPSTSIVKGDEKSISIAAASIIAKVERDNFMKELSKKFPEYEFEKNKGYGTKKHIRSIHKFGATKWHRKSFKPIKTIIS